MFYENSLKFFLSLYGHKLPVMSLDFSSDGRLLVSGSADKTIKIWGTRLHLLVFAPITRCVVLCCVGMDFGDCHRSLLGHDDSITSLRFIPNTHHFFSGSKDSVVKYWDADTFQQILSLPGHVSAVWAIDIGE